MCVGAIESKFYDILMEKLGFSENEIPQFENFDESRHKIAEVFKKKTQKEWCAIFDDTDACVTPMLNLKEVASHNHNEQRQAFKTVGDDVIPNPAPRLSRTPGISVGTLVNPQPGENTIEILTELNLQSMEIDDLISNGFAYQTQIKSKF